MCVCLFVFHRSGDNTAGGDWNTICNALQTRKMGSTPFQATNLPTLLLGLNGCSHRRTECAFFMVRDPQRWFELARWSTLRHARRNNNGFQHRTRGPGFPSEETLEKSVFSRTFYRLRHRATRTPHKHPASLSRFLVCPRTTSRLFLKQSKRGERRAIAVAVWARTELSVVNATVYGVYSVCSTLSLFREFDKSEIRRGENNAKESVVPCFFSVNAISI